MNESTGMSKPLRRWRWRIFSATWLSYAGYYFCRKPFYITKATLEDAYGWDPTKLGLLGGAYLAFYALGQFIAGWAGSRFGPRLVLLVGMGVSVGANFTFGITNSWGTFLAFMALNGLAQASGWSGNVGAMAPWFRRSERGTIMGFWATNFQVGSVVANFLAAFMLGLAGFKWSFFTGSIVLVGVWVFFLFNQRNRPQDVGLPPLAEDDLESAERAGASESDPSRGVGWSRNTKVNVFIRGAFYFFVKFTRGVGWSWDTKVNVFIMGAFYFFVKFIRYSLWSWTPYLLKRNYGLETDEAGYLSTTFDVAGIAGVIILGVLSDRLFRGRRALISTLFIACMGGGCVALYLFASTSLVLFAVCLGVVGFFLFGPDAIMTSAGAIDVGGRRGATLAAGIINGMGSVGSIAQEPVLGYLIGAGSIAGVFGALLASSMCALVLMGLLLWRNHTGKADM